MRRNKDKLYADQMLKLFLKDDWLKLKTIIHINYKMVESREEDLLTDLCLTNHTGNQLK